MNATKATNEMTETNRTTEPRAATDTPRKRIEVVAAIIRHEGRILAAQRGYGEFKDGWEFPGGKTEPGETPERALVREIEEELAVRVKPEVLLTTVEYDYPTFHLTMHCFLSTIEAGEIEMKEHEALRWLAPDELDRVEWLPADVEVVEKLKAHLALDAGATENL
ncbi:DNA mismatch repair protein MutT [Sutterella megalosphaeroides]|uniref:8-oxo-dGTP diphosphatase n=2 Tax=Sutterella megalosphaeroides TaxID=2494234 RepID=A0A2Z6IA24_9BURK|nr:DNA mismatch repair protein MutT [Sutterella megalosphaeroides]